LADFDAAAIVPGALAGIRVLDLSQVAAGPYLGSLFGDLGADVIKVEPPAGEAFRSIDADFGIGHSAYFFGLNRSKRAITLDLKNQDDYRAFEQLLATVDVVLTSMRSSAAVSLRIDYDSLAAINPRIVYCAITGWGETGPRATEPGMDLLAQAVGGIMGTTGEPDRGPVKAGPPVSDFATTFIGGFAICAALRARDRDGVGQKISLNLLDCTIAFLSNYVTPYFKTGRPIRPVGGGHPQLVPYQVFEASDGYFVLGCLNDRFWPPVCDAIGHPELADDERYRTNPDRVANRGTLVPFLEDIFIVGTREHWVSKLREHDVPAAPVHRLEEVFDDPQAIHNEMLLELRHPEFGTYFAPNNPMHMSRTPPAPWGYAPEIGEHNAEILAELKISDDEAVA
jgi:crotonobetainyl-CoA:carnitine CoA-transferase CaiB-like acyl-CoA transferase